MALNGAEIGKQKNADVGANSMLFLISKKLRLLG